MGLTSDYYVKILLFYLVASCLEATSEKDPGTYVQHGYKIPKLRPDYAISVDSYSARPQCDMRLRGSTYEEDMLAHKNWMAMMQMECGKRTLSEPPADAEEIRAGESHEEMGRWPWHVTLLTSRDGRTWNLCGGILIRKDWIITTATCATANQVIILLGIGGAKTDKYQGLRFTQKRKIKKKHLHPLFTPAKERKDDIAMVELNKPATLNEYIGLPCLADYNNPAMDPFQNDCFLVGQGHRGPEAKITGPERFLREIKRTRLSYEECTKRYGNAAGITDEAKEFCIAEPDSMKKKNAQGKLVDTPSGSCKGDRGAGLHCSYFGRWFVTGLVQTTACGKANTPDAVLNFEWYAEWMLGILKNYTKKAEPAEAR